MIAGNNICAKRYLGLVEKFGLKFVQLAGEKMIEDSEAKSRAKLRSMPDGTWVTRQYVTTLDRKDAQIRSAAALLHDDEESATSFISISPARARKPTPIITRPCRAPSLISRWR